jgi:hypothetical protein
LQYQINHSNGRQRYNQRQRSHRPGHSEEADNVMLVEEHDHMVEEMDEKKEEWHNQGEEEWDDKIQKWKRMI